MRRGEEKAVFSCGKSLVLSTGSAARRKKVEFGAGNYVSVAEKFGACSVHDCKDVFCLGDVGGVAGDD